jgi:hypothetical protein
MWAGYKIIDPAEALHRSNDVTKGEVFCGFVTTNAPPNWLGEGPECQAIQFTPVRLSTDGLASLSWID